MGNHYGIYCIFALTVNSVRLFYIILKAKKKVERRKEMGIREEPQFIVEETYDDFDMESAFHPDLHKSTAEQYG